MLFELSMVLFPFCWKNHKTYLRFLCNFADSCYSLSHSPIVLRLHHYLICNFRLIFSHFQYLRFQSFLDVYVVKVIFHRENCAERNLLKLPIWHFWVIVALVIKTAKPVVQNPKRILENYLGSAQTVSKSSFVWE